MKHRWHGFTLLELIIVIGVIMILAAIVFVAVDPAKRLADARNSSRWIAASSLIDAFKIYQADTGGELPLGIDENLRMIGTATSGCDIGCGSMALGTQAFTHEINADFAGGVFAGTQWNSGLELSAAGRSAKSGFFESAVYDAGQTVFWQNMSWKTSSPLQKELPDNQTSETAYTTGNADMNGNVLLMHFNETSGSIQDSSGNGHSGSYNGNLYGQTGKLNEAIGFDGSNDRITIPNSQSLNPSTHITLMAWVKWNINPTTGNQWAQIISKNQDNQYQIQHNNVNTRFEFALRTDTPSNPRRYIIGSTQPVQGGWYHVAGVYDGSFINLYVNGALDARTAHTGNIVSSTSPVYIGNRTTDRHFNGLIDEVAIFDRALSASEIQNIYRRGALQIIAQARSCPTPDCSGKDFVGPNGTTGDFYAPAIDNGSANPSFSIANEDPNPFFQYKFFLDTDNTTLTPKVSEVSVEYAENIIDENAAPECLNIIDDIKPYLGNIPTDPQYGNEEKTFYAVKKDPLGSLFVKACGAEREKIIEVQR